MADDAGPGPLVVRFGALGDLIQATSLFQSLYRAWGLPCDVLAAHGFPEAVVHGLATVHDVRTVDSRRTPYWLSRSQWHAVAWLRRWPAGPAWLIEPRERPADKSLWLLARAGIPRDRIVDAREVPRGPLEHTVDYLHRVAARTPAGVQPPPSPLPAVPPLPRLHVEDDELKECRRWLTARGWRGEPVVVLQTQSRRTNRGRWPDAQWIAAARGVLRRLPEARLLLAGTPRELPEIRRLAAACDDRRVEAAAADLPLRRLFALLALAHSCISLDSGPAHAAATLGCPVAVLPGMADPRRVAPRGAPGSVRVVASIPESAWPDDPMRWQVAHRMEAIDVDAVLEAWLAVSASRPVSQER
ncbi:MAG: glycosyltransferase family 9 protein [Thermoanaerobaculia bacterium]